MFERIIDRIIEKQIQNNVLKQEDLNIYRYGYILVYEVVLNIIIALIIGLLFKSLEIVFSFLFFFIPLRSFCGGWHADKIWKCTVVSNMILLLCVILEKYLVEQISIYILVLLFFISAAVILSIAPIETNTKKISKEEKIIYRKKICAIIILHTIVIILLSFFDLKRYILTEMFSYIIQVLFLFLEKINICIHKIKK